jgi:sterol 3beta-glucosyltransferase
VSLRVAMHGWGSEGDLRPLVALAAGLVRAGHRVRLELTPIDGSDYSGPCGAAGVELRVIPGLLDFGLHTVATGAEALDPLRVSRALVDRAFFPYLDALYGAALELCDDADVVVWHYASWYAKAAALRTSTPDVAVQLYPGLVPSRHLPPGGLPDLGPLNPLLWRLARVALDVQFRKRPARFFAARGLPPVRHVMPDLLFSERLNLHAFSPVLVPPAPDWGPLHRAVGQLALEAGHERWRPSAELEAFLGEGEAPVLLSLGSMEHLAPARARELLVGAARAARVRAIVQTKREEGERRDGDVFVLPWAPHHALLPRCAAMVHHGGAGTTHAALHAGVPAVVVPFIPEQRAWAGRLRAVGAAGRDLPFWKATPEGLAGRIREALDSGALRARARECAGLLAREDGVATAVGLVERAA